MKIVKNEFFESSLAPPAAFFWNESLFLQYSRCMAIQKISILVGHMFHLRPKALFVKSQCQFFEKILILKGAVAHVWDSGWTWNSFAHPTRWTATRSRSIQVDHMIRLRKIVLLRNQIFDLILLIISARGTFEQSDHMT